MKNTAYCPIHINYHPNERVYDRRVKIGVSIGMCLLFLFSFFGCAVRYKSGANCWSAEMVSTEDWCEKQRVIDKVSPTSLGVHDHRPAHNDYPFRDSTEERQPPMSFDLGPTEYGKGKP